MTERRTALVTGGGSGIGRAVAHRLAADGFAVAVLDLNSDTTRQVVEEITEAGNEAIAAGGVDVSDRAAVNAAVETVPAQPGPVLALVNSAGITCPQSPEVRLRSLVSDEELAAITAPTLVIWTSDDPSGPAKAGLDTAERLPAGEFRLIKDAGHWPQWEQQEEFDGIAREFVGRGV
ncbi:SDR family NAD(P)-dependent oxidoreductase [Pseudofrankia sp. DC12]|uniref:SDR family NAD(P)-dependent oxidoreductase n=1 Tax=Pseudofrankia sp. DC12 TaxID=683315 RepID=UPI0005F7CFD0|nr:SDR family NAD(P)-dependent oxidoreductase [Pseudofrankia sp. DC12]